MPSKGWIVTAAGVSLNLALGILYAWSMFGKQLTETVANGGFGWSRATLAKRAAVQLEVGDRFGGMLPKVYG